MPGPFDLEDTIAYRAWRDAKLADRPARVEELVVEVRDPRRLTAAERDALLERCARANLAFYVSRETGDGKDLPRLLGRQLGLERLQANWLADKDGISAITPGEGTRGEYIPYTERALSWHTDGYYDPPGRPILGMILHCVRTAAEGGESALLDHEIAYLRLRDENPDWIRALCAPDAMTIPARMEGNAVARAAESGPVFSVAAGALHMRYSARGTNIVWRDDGATRAARTALERLLGEPESPWIYRLRLATGMGIVCNNVLHKRSAFRDRGTPRRLLYRLRYLDRIAAPPAAHQRASSAPASVFAS